MGMLTIRDRNAARGYTVHTACVHPSTRFDRFGDEVCRECGEAARFGVCPPNEVSPSVLAQRPVRHNTQNSHGDTVCWSCKGDAYACDCPVEDTYEGDWLDYERLAIEAGIYAQLDARRLP